MREQRSWKKINIAGGKTEIFGKVKEGGEASRAVLFGT